MLEERETVTNMPSFEDIPEFFRDTTIFITGATGFLGQVLISKLLSSCPDICKIYILMREKNNRSIQERVHGLLEAPIFEKIKLQDPKICLKIIAINGDCKKKYLGLSDRDCLTLQNEVNVVFHVAATVAFNAPLRDAVNINVQSTRDLLEIAKKMVNLKSFIHISTAFSFCGERKIIEEKSYESPMPASSLITLVAELSDPIIEKITPILLGSFPNTYVFTKAVAEGLYSAKSLDIPFSIFRPAIVGSTAKEPLPGWINPGNLNGPSGVIAGYGVGLIHTIHSNADCKSNIVPCDYVINALIAVAWHTALYRKNLKLNLKKPNDINVQPVPVFNYGSSEGKNSPTWYQLMRNIIIFMEETPCSTALWKPFIRLNKNEFAHNLSIIFLHLLPAIIIDKIAIVFGKQPKLMKTYRRIHKFLDVLSYFTTREWVITTDNMQKVLNTLSEQDRKMFDFDLNEINWRQYYNNQQSGIRLYLINDGLETIPYAIEKRKKLVIIHYTLLSIIILLFGIFLYILRNIFVYYV